MWPALRHRGYRLLWIGSLFAYGGNWINQATMGWVAYDITGSATFLGLILGSRAIPVLLLAPIAGVAADRFSARRLLAASNTLNVLLAAALGALLALDLARPWHLIAMVIAGGVGHVFDRTARQTAVQDLVPREAVMNAVSLNIIAFSFMRVLSPALAGYLIAWLSAAANFLVQAGLYAVAVLLLYGVAFPRRAANVAHGSVWTSLREGFRFVRRDPITRTAMLLNAVPFFFLLPVWGTLLPIYARDVFQAGPQGMGWLYTSVGVGGVAGGLASAALSRFDRLGWLQIASTTVFVAALTCVALSPTITVAVPFVIGAGIGEMLSMSAAQSMLQLAAPQAMRGRVLGLMQFNPALISLGSVLVGIGADLFGARGITLIACGTALVVLLGITAAAPSILNVRASTLAQRQAD